MRWREEILTNVGLQRLYASVALEQQNVMECVDGLRHEVRHLVDYPSAVRTLLGSALSKAASVEWVELE